MGFVDEFVGEYVVVDDDEEDVAVVAVVVVEVVVVVVEVVTFAVANIFVVGPNSSELEAADSAVYATGELLASANEW